MKNTSKLACLASLGLMSGLCMLASVNVTNGVGFDIDLNFAGNLSDTTHVSRLKTLFLGPVGNSAWMATSKDSDRLDVFKGLVIEKSVNGRECSDECTLVVIGGGQGNTITAKNSGIAGGSGNDINKNLGAIGGGASNKVSQEKGVIAGGISNRIEGTTTNNKGGIVLGGDNNTSDAGVVLGGQGNNIGKNGLAMGKSAKGGARSFVRNDGTLNNITANENSALIGTKSGVLIGTYEPVDGASLVVDGAVKIGTRAGAAVAGEIRSESDGCLYAYDGEDWHILGKNSKGSCSTTPAVICEFGRILLQEGDTAVAYSATYSSDCSTVQANVKCENVGGTGKLRTSDGSTSYVYSTCYKTEPNPYH